MDKSFSQGILGEMALKACGVDCIYDKVAAVEGFSYEFKQGCTYGIVGPSGSGKSSLASLFNGLTRSSVGEIHLFNGLSIKGSQRKIKDFKALRRTVGLVLQFPEYQLFKDSVVADVAYGPKVLGVEPSKAIELAQTKLLELGVPESIFFANPLKLSGGQRRKVALAGVLAINPEIVIFDEPTIGLDPASRVKIIEIMYLLKAKGKTVIVLSHNMDMVLELSDHILVLDQGKLVGEGSPYEVFTNPNLPVGKPDVVRFIEKLVAADRRFEGLYKYEPRDVHELSKALSFKE